VINGLVFFGTHHSLDTWYLTRLIIIIKICEKKKSLNLNINICKRLSNSYEKKKNKKKKYIKGMYVFGIYVFIIKKPVNI